MIPSDSSPVGLGLFIRRGGERRAEGKAFPKCKWKESLALAEWRTQVLSMLVSAHPHPYFSAEHEECGVMIHQLRLGTLASPHKTRCCPKVSASDHFSLEPVAACKQLHKLPRPKPVCIPSSSSSCHSPIDVGCSKTARVK